MRITTKEMRKWCRDNEKIFIKRINYNTFCYFSFKDNAVIYIRDWKNILVRDMYGYIILDVGRRPKIATVLTYLLPEEWEVLMVGANYRLTNIITRESFLLDGAVHIPIKQPYDSDGTKDFAIVEYLDNV